MDHCVRAAVDVQQSVVFDDTFVFFGPSKDSSFQIEGTLMTLLAQERMAIPASEVRIWRKIGGRFAIVEVLVSLHWRTTLMRPGHRLLLCRSGARNDYGLDSTILMPPNWIPAFSIPKQSCEGSDDLGH